MKKLFVILLVSLFIASCESTTSNVTNNTVQESQNTEKEEMVVTQENNIFDNLSELIKKLSTVWVWTLWSWKDDGFGDYFSLTPYKQIGTNSNLALYVYGTEKTKANKIELVLNINTVSDKTSALEQMSDIVKNICTTLNIEWCDSVILATKEWAEIVEEHKYILSIKKDISNIETYIFRINN